jgi:hypothetical protein
MDGMKLDWNTHYMDELDTYIANVNRIPDLSKPEEDVLAASIQRDSQADVDKLA